MKRIPLLIIFSPIILTVLMLMLLTACVYYAVNGKWELREIVSQYYTPKARNV